MGELLGSLIPVKLKWNGLACPNSSCVQINCEGRVCWRTCFCSSQHRSAMKLNRSFLVVCELNMATMSMKGCLLHQLNSLNGPGRMANLLAVSNFLASNGCGLAFEENEEKEVIQSGKDELDVDSSGQFLPPWGNLMVQQEPDLVSESTVQASVNPRNTVRLNEVRVHLLEQVNEEELSRRILMLSRSNMVRSALELFMSMEFSGLQPNCHACNSLISCLIRNKLFDHALRVFNFMKSNKNLTSHTYTLILKAVSDSQGYESSLNMFAELGGFSREDNGFDVIVYNTMLSVCGRVNNWVDAERIWRKMKENGCYGTEVTYSLLIGIFVRSGHTVLALDAYNEMDQNGIVPRDDTLQAVIGAFTKEGKWDLALKVFQNMLNRGLKPNLIACNALINSLGKAGKHKLAFEVFEKVKSLGHTPDAYTWNALLNGLYRANHFADALQLFESIKKEQNSEINEHLYNTALLSCQKLRLWDKAIQLLWQLEASGLPITTTSYNLVIGACENARKPKVALQVYEHMVHQKHTPDTFTYLSLIRSCVWASLWEELEEILEQVAPDISLYNAVIHGMCLRGRFKSARKLYMKMRKSGLRPDGKTRALMLQNLKKGSTKRSR